MKRNSSGGNGAFMTSRRILHHLAAAAAIPSEDTDAKTEASRPSTPSEETVDSGGATPHNSAIRAWSAFKFGDNTAARFDLLWPIMKMTPIPLSVVQQIFLSDVKETEEEAGTSRDTARNVDTLQ